MTNTMTKAMIEGRRLAKTFRAGRVDVLAQSIILLDGTSIHIQDPTDNSQEVNVRVTSQVSGG